MNSDVTPRPAAQAGALPAGRVCRAAVALWAACAVVCAGLDLQQGAVVTLRGFKTQGRAENGARWRLQGESAVIRGAVYELAGVTVDLDLEDGKTARITSRACVYHQDSGLVESHDPVRMESGGATLDGVGFDMLMSERRLRVRDAVRMELPASEARPNPLGPAASGGLLAIPDAAPAKQIRP
jgi:hypothetical protein